MTSNDSWARVVFSRASVPAHSFLHEAWCTSDVADSTKRTTRRQGAAARQPEPGDEIVAYATERSFSATGWQTVQRKAGFVGQLMRADPNGPRTLEAADEQTLSYGQIKAMATGDPAFLEMADLDASRPESGNTG